jgi:chloramphenicol-sensitive protein RarD
MAGETEFVHEEGAVAEAPPPSPNHEAAGVAYGVLAYSWWGAIIPVYVWALATRWGVSAEELLAHRVVWGVPVMALLLTYRRKWGSLRSIVATRSSLVTLLWTTGLIAVNWYTFTWSVANGRAAEVALGYYINPLVSIALGMVFLGERMRRAQWVCVAIAAAGVAAETAVLGRPPYLGLLVAGSFGSYGLLRKRAKADADVGLTVEMTLVAPLGVAWLAWAASRGEMAWLSDGTPAWVNGLLLLGGVMTVVPLLAFTESARRLRLGTVGFLQYIAPTGQFLMAVLVFGESFPPGRWASFGLIWLALVVFSAESVRAARRQRALTRAGA